MAKGCTLTFELIRSIRCSLTAGMLPKEVARIHPGVKLSTVYAIKNGKVKIDTPRRRALARRTLVKQLRAKGLTYTAIAEQLGVSRQRVEQLVNNQRMVEYNRRRRNRGEHWWAKKKAERAAENPLDAPF